MKPKDILPISRAIGLAISLLLFCLIFTQCKKKISSESPHEEQLQKSPLPQRTPHLSEVAPNKQEENISLADIPTTQITYAPEAAGPRDTLFYGSIKRSDEVPLQNGVITLKTRQTPSDKLFATVPLPPNGKFKIPVNSSHTYRIMISDDNITTTGFAIT